LGEIPENLGNILETPGKIPKYLVKTGAQCLQKPNEDLFLFWGGHTKKGLHDLCDRKFVGRSRTKSFRASLGKFGQKSFAPPKISLLLHLWQE